MRAASSFIAALVLSLAACSADDTGTLDLALTGQAPSGTAYRLRAGQLIIAGAGTTRVVSTEDDPDRRGISLGLAPGAYTLSVADGWFLDRQAADGSFAPVPATLTSTNPAAFAIEPGEATRVTLRFLAGADDVALDDGTLDIDIAIDEVDAPDAGAPDAGIPDAAPPPPVASGDSIEPGEVLPIGAQLRTSDVLGTATFSLRSDGNLVFTGVFGTSWSSGTAGLGGTALFMRADGNLVLLGADEAVLWSTGTAGNPGARFVVGFLSVDLLGSDNTVIWSRP